MKANWYRLAYTARQIDERAQRYIRGSMGWSYHARCSGHEAIQVALGLAFRANKDFLFTYYRDTATVLAAGMTSLELMLNGLSKQGDTGSGGRHMSNHFAKPSIGIQSVSSCTGSHTLHAVGVARAIRYYESDGIAFCSQGDSSASEGYCFEAYSGAARDKLPVLFVIQNNGYGISVPVAEQSANLCVADNFIGLKNLLITRCDGTDFEDSHRAIQEALAYIKSGKGPAMVHAQCIRMGAHSNSDAQELYRSKEEIAEAQTHDPLPKLRAMLKPKEAEKIEQEIEKALDQAALEAEAAPAPTPESVFEFAESKMWEGPFLSGTPGEEEKLREAINRTLQEEFAHNPDTFLWGQDVASKDKGGVFNLTKGMLAKFGHKRVFNAPIAEDFIVGTANGLCRFKPEIRVVIEAAQFADYVWPAMEQIVIMSHEHWRTRGQFSPNVVLRLASGGYITGGLYHSQNIEAIMSHLPGVRVVYPAFADDAAGLLRMAMRSEGVTFFLEPKHLYNRTEAKGPNLGPEHVVEFGKSRIRRLGRDLTIITYGNTVSMSLQVADKLASQYDIEVLDLRSIKPLDITGIAESIKKTSRALIVHEDHRFNGIAGEITAQINETCFEYLDAPVRRVTALDIPIGFSKILETAILPQPDKIEQAALDLLKY